MTHAENDRRAAGIYNLTESLKISSPNQVLLGLGLATLISGAGKPCIEVADVAGVRVAGVMMQAGCAAPILCEQDSFLGGFQSPFLLALARRLLVSAHTAVIE